MRWQAIFSIIGFMIVLCGFMMMIPATIDFLSNAYHTAIIFATTAALTVSAGSVVLLATNQIQAPLKTKEMFITTTLIWCFYTFFCALPYFFSHHELGFAKSLFESVSGLTTTGATVFHDLSTLSNGTLFWRSLTHWMGGLGILVVAILILPTLRLGGMQLFNIEVSGESNRDAPTIFQNVSGILIYFSFLTVFSAICLKLAGMSTFDAINHAMSVTATGGFSTHNESIAYFNSPLIEWILTLFMFWGGLPLMMGIYLFHNHFDAIRKNEQIKLYAYLFIGTSFALSFLRWAGTGFNNDTLSEILRTTIFTITSLLTTTGFTVSNYQEWGNYAVSFFVFFILLGSCTGSTAGGIKLFRVSILTKVLHSKLKTIARPHGIFIPRYGNTPISEDIVFGVITYIGLYLISLIFGTIALAFCGLDFVTCFSGTISALSNIGPALGSIIGPDQTYAFLPSAAHYILSFLMLLGRLEFVAVLILFFPFFWKKNI